MGSFQTSLGSGSPELNYLTIKEVSGEVRYGVKLVRLRVVSLLNGGDLKAGSEVLAHQSPGGRRHFRVHRDAVAKIKASFALKV
jgi:hypothetical protein